MLLALEKVSCNASTTCSFCCRCKWVYSVNRSEMD
jgi:hypothetical protein